MGATRHDSRASVFDARVRPVAARAVGGVLVETAEGAPLGRAPDLAGPGEANLVDMARAFVAHHGLDIVVDAQAMEGVPPGALLPGDGARVQGPGFEQWLSSEDAARLGI